MDVSAKLVKELRDKTGAGMMDCKRALIETECNLEAATEYLRKKGLMDAAKKSSRTTADGLIAFSLSPDRRKASIIEVNSETDFVARNDKFQEVVSGIANISLAHESSDAVLGAKFPDTDRTVREELDLLISLVGENVNFRRCQQLSVNHGAVSAYMHGAVKPGMGKIGVLVAIESEKPCDPGKVDELGKKLAMHIAAANPSYLCQKCVPPEVIAKEKEIILAQAAENGKAPDIAEKMAEGRIKKFFEECALLEQIFVIDGKTKVGAYIENFNKTNGTTLSVSSFIKYVLGEGINKQETNFAEEVQSFIK
ncbi:MAG: translation elongation factor Ts [Holosporales bacterium]|jgi:elongation factor Ts|nr:translation elongation factor Ts [Holosporales bacterium]